MHRAHAYNQTYITNVGTTSLHNDTLIVAAHILGTRFGSTRDFGTITIFHTPIQIVTKVKASGTGSKAPRNQCRVATLDLKTGKVTHTFAVTVTVFFGTYVGGRNWKDVVVLGMNNKTNK